MFIFYSFMFNLISFFAAGPGFGIYGICHRRGRNNEMARRIRCRWCQWNEDEDDGDPRFVQDCSGPLYLHHCLGSFNSLHWIRFSSQQLRFWSIWGTFKDICKGGKLEYLNKTSILIVSLKKIRVVFHIIFACTSCF